MRTSRRRYRWVLYMLAAGLLWAAGPTAAHAQEVDKQKDENNNFTFTGTNPCFADEPFTVQGRQRTREESGPNKFRFRQQSEGQGFGATGAQYNFADFSENEVVTTSTNFVSEFQEREHIIRNGKNPLQPQVNDDFFLRTRQKLVVKNGVPTVNRSDDRTECK
jgi:hypothetical protein